MEKAGSVYKLHERLFKIMYASVEQIYVNIRGFPKLNRSQIELIELI